MLYQTGGAALNNIYGRYGRQRDSYGGRTSVCNR